MRSSALALLACALAAPAAWAQESDAERAARAARAEAMKLANQALDGMERFARGGPPAPLEREDALQQALERLEGPVVPEAPEPPGEVGAMEAYELLDEFRLGLEARLRRLAPDRYPPPASEEEPVYVLRFHDVRELLDEVEDHVGPNMGLGSGLDPSGAFDDPEATVAGVALEPDQVEELVVNAVGEDLWDDPASIEIERGRLIIRQTPAVHTKIAGLLERLRRAQTGLVELELRIYRLPTGVHDALGAGAAALDAAGERALAGAVQRKEATLVATHRLVAHDGQRVNVHRGSSRSILAAVRADETGAVPVLEPVVNALNVGQVIEVRPIVDRALGRVLLDVAVSLCEAEEPWETRSVDGDELDLPRVRIARTSSTTVVPLGRGALLGGLLAQGGLEEEDSLSTVVYVRATLLGGK